MKINRYKIRLAIAGTVLILCILTACGLLRSIRITDIQFTPLLQRLLCDFSVIAAVLFGLIIILTLLFGRIYCSTICPLGILQEFISFLRGKKKNTAHPNSGLKYLIAGLTFGCLFGGSAIFIRYTDPYTVFTSTATLTIFGIVFTSVVIITVFLKNRLFCTNICPVGAVLGLISKMSLNKIYTDDNCVKCGICENFCPSGCIKHNAKTVDNEICVKCLKCLSICPQKAIKYGVKPVKFNPKRRDFILGIGALTFLSAGCIAGINFAKNTAKKVKDIILPPGALNTKRMADKCLNCNLCVNNCPNKILSKADEKFQAVHIDYEKGKHYCEYNCTTCSEVCPTGAIKKISKEEKHNTKIATASISKNCVGCGRCIKACPVGAISLNENKTAVADESKCIGCGKCATVCGLNAITLYPAEEQTTV